MNRHNQKAAEGLVVLFATLTGIAVRILWRLLWRMSGRSFFNAVLMGLSLYYIFTFAQYKDWSFFNVTHEYLYSFFGYLGVPRYYTWYISRFLVAMFFYTSIRAPIYILWALFISAYGIQFQSIIIFIAKMIGYINITNYSNYGLLCLMINMVGVFIIFYMSIKGKEFNPFSGIFNFLSNLKYYKKRNQKFKDLILELKRSILSRRLSPLERNFNVIAKIYQRNPSKAGYKFEKFGRDLLRSVGMTANLAMDLKKAGDYPPVLKKTKGDGGVDIIATKKGVVYVIQAKLKLGKTPVKGEDVSKTHTAGVIFKEYYKSKNKRCIVTPVILTTGRLDNTAKAYARQFGITVWDVGKIDRFIKTANLERRNVKIGKESSFFYDFIGWACRFRLG